MQNSARQLLVFAGLGSSRLPHSLYLTARPRFAADAVQLYKDV